MALKTLIFGFALLLAAPPVLAQSHRFALIIGNNEGDNPEETLRYAHRDAQKMYNLLTEIGRFKQKNTVLLLEKKSTEVWRHLKEIEKKAARYHREGKKTMLLIYYSGHAQGDALEMSGSSLKFEALRQYLEQSKIHVRLAFVDSCHSGQLISAKGAARGKSFQIKVNDEISSAGYAIITSSSQNELSQESKELRGAFFTHHLASALRGSADSSKDGKVTLQEAYKYAYAKTLAQTVGSAGASQHPMYHFQLKGQGEIVLTHTRKSVASIQIPYIESGRVLLLDGIGEEVLAEAEATRDTPIHFSVPPGPFVVYIVKKSGAVRVAEVEALPHQRALLGPDDFSTTTLTTAVAKGGLFRVPEHLWNHKMGIFGIWRTGPLDGIQSAVGGGIHYRLQHVSGIQPTLRLSVTAAPDAGVSKDFRDVSAMAGIGYVFEMTHLFFRTELLVGYEHMFQSSASGEGTINERPHTSSFAGLGTAGLELPFSYLYVFLDGGAGVRVFQVVGRDWVPRFELQALLGVGIRWEVD